MSAAIAASIATATIHAVREERVEARGVGRGCAAPRASSIAATDRNSAATVVADSYLIGENYSRA